MLDPSSPLLTTDDVLDRQHEEELLAAILAVVYLLMLRETHALVLDALDLDPLQFRITRSDISRQLELAAERSHLITGTTERAIRDLLQEARTVGMTQAEMVTALDHMYRETFALRPALQASNEAHNATLENSQSRYRASGVVTEQLIRDGDTFDQPCRDRNGTTVPITTYVGQLHVGCTVITSPVRAKP